MGEQIKHDQSADMIYIKVNPGLPYLYTAETSWDGIRFDISDQEALIGIEVDGLAVLVDFITNHTTKKS